MNTNQNTRFNKVPNFMMIILGAFLTATAVSLFFLPNKIISGSIVAIATILYYFFKAPPGIIIAAINIILLVVGYKILGKQFIIKTVIGAGLYSVFVQVLSYIPKITSDTFLCVVFGGSLYGLGIALVFISGSTTGGSDIMARALAKQI